MMFLVISAPFIALALPVGTATLTWDPPTTNTDATLLTDLAGYKLYYGTASGNYSVNVSIPCGILPCPNSPDVNHPTTVAISGLEDTVTWYFAVTALDTSANESGYSNEVLKDLLSGVFYLFTVARSGTGTGIVTSTPSGINCGATCSASYSSGASVILTATVASDSTFIGWSGACSGVATSCSTTMDASKNVTANFVLNTYALTVTKTGTGTGTVTSSPVGVNCGVACSANYNSGTSVILTAASAPDSTFTGWSGACSGTGTCTVSMTQARSVTAIFDVIVKTLIMSSAEFSRADFNGDGRQDVGYIEIAIVGGQPHIKVHVGLSDGITYQTPTLWFDWVKDGEFNILIGDVNGDRKSDIIMIQKGPINAMLKHIFYVALSSGVTFGSPVVWMDWLPRIGVYQFHAGDFNGDGKTDIVAIEDKLYNSGTGQFYYNPSIKIDFWMAKSTGTQFVPDGSVLGVGGLWMDWLPRIGVYQFHAGDFNGDGKTDIVAIEDKYYNPQTTILEYNAAFKIDYWMALSMGSSFSPGGSYLSVSGLWYEKDPRDGRFEFRLPRR